MKKGYTVTLQGIEKLAKELAPKLHGGEVLALIGNLGSGKTTFSKALGRALGITNNITSPTFTILNQYLIPKKKNQTQQQYFYHLDLYRTKSYAEVRQLGVEEFWTTPQTITIIEWADMITKQLPPKTIFLHFISDINETKSF